jgi:glutamyl endopeptidase
MSHRPVSRSLPSVLAAIALLAGALPAAAHEELAEDPNAHRMVASDGSPQLVIEESWAYSAGSPDSTSGFEGYAPMRLADDSYAELRSEPETAEEIWALVDRAAGVAPLGRESVIGADTRTRVNATTTYPARAVGLVTYSRGGKNYICTGNLIGKNTVLTAGHCVHAGDGKSTSWSTNVRFYPGRNGSKSPYGSCTAKRLYSVTGWTQSGNEQYDYGAIKLNCSIGNTTGHFGFFWQSASLAGLPAVINGYPGDKPAGTQWRATGAVKVSQTRQSFYQNDTAGGMSGSGVYYNRSGCGQCIHTVHANGLHGAKPHSNNNHGARITKAVYDNLVAWRNAP